MKWPVLLAASPLVLGLICASASAAVSENAPALVDLYQRLERGGALEHRFDALMQGTMPRVAAAVGDSRKVFVNSAYSASAINVYVVSPERLGRVTGAAPGFRNWREMSGILQGNFIAIPQNLVFVDDAFLGLFLLVSYSNSITSLELEKGVERFTPVGDRHEVAGTFSSYMRMSLVMLDRSVLRREIEAWDSSPSGLRQWSVPEQERIFFVVMLLLLGHEFAHLRDGSATSGYVNV